jgi:integrase
MNRRGFLGPFFAYCRRKRAMTLNPFEDQRQRAPKRRKELAPILSPEKAAALMTYVEGNYRGRCVPYFALCLFAGVRPGWRNGEISKLGAQHIRLDRDEIRVTTEVSKVTEACTIRIRPNPKEWLARYPVKKFPILFPNIRKVMPAIREKFALEYDVGTRWRWFGTTTAARSSIRNGRRSFERSDRRHERRGRVMNR